MLQLSVEPHKAFPILTIYFCVTQRSLGNCLQIPPESVGRTQGFQMMGWGETLGQLRVPECLLCARVFRAQPGGNF